jgi:uncharacterized protein YjiS (DUF1127 family)
MTTRTLSHSIHGHSAAFRAPVALDRLGGALKRTLGALRTWSQRSRERAQLGGLSDRMLSDIGVSRADAVFLSNKPFWRE